MVEDFKKMLQLFIDTNKSKYVDLLYQIIKHDVEKLEPEINIYFLNNVSEDSLKKVNRPLLYIIADFIRMRYGPEQIETFNEFIENNENNRIKDNDLSKYKSFEEINKANYVATLNLDSKELEQQMIKVYEDENYLIIRPLTYFSSLKYGKSTKWCTSSEKTPEYFWRYASEGILIYLIDKINNFKYGIFKSLTHSEISFWDEEDLRIDSYQMKVISDIKEIVYKVIDTEKRANRSYMSEHDSEKEREIVMVRNQLGYIPLYSPVGGYIGSDSITFVDTIKDDKIHKLIKERNQERLIRNDTLSSTFDFTDF